MRAHFVKFYNPGTIVAEHTVLPIDSWDVEQAVKQADDIVERHGATPYAFRFLTKAREDDELDSKIVEKSNLYYLGGKVETLGEITERNHPSDRILISNMRANNWAKVIRNANSYGWTMPLEKDDVVLDYVPPHKRKVENNAINP